MREEIRLALVAAVPEVQGRVLEPHAATPEEPLPFLIVAETEITDEADHKGPDRTIEVVAFVRQTSFTVLDAILAKVTAALENKVFGDPQSRYLLRSNGSAGEDMVDDDMNALIRGVSFAVHSLLWTNDQTDLSNILQMWTQRALPAAQVNGATMVPTKESPGVYWHYMPGTGQPIEWTVWGAWVEAELRGHVITPNKQDAIPYLRALYERLTLQRELRLSDNSKLFIQPNISVDSEANEFSDGQIRVRVRYGILHGMVLVPTLDHVYLDANNQQQDVEVHRPHAAADIRGTSSATATAAP